MQIYPPLEFSKNNQKEVRTFILLTFSSKNKQGRPEIPDAPVFKPA